ncbi:uncharacterized protein E0L32_001078 [Thyridium curvatum]|uniref:Amidase domain-containing protein n=1 Tax=Thyridium curvatum TaxID=1093900 RepID=A0A507B3T0_9PEZI|nr:uncharacterized protein E0L32_001078 [Thyridium curvatum]TPX11260.1 hypothetical protein E0L32_001078 [Thyridium curvatum]
MSLTAVQVPDGHTPAAAFSSSLAKEDTSLAVVQPNPVPRGTAEYEKQRANLLNAFAAKVPDAYRLPIELISNPPKDVTAVPSTCGILTASEIDITENYDASGLAEAIASRKLTAVAVATAFAKRAIIAHQLTCCLTQWFMDDAIEQARQLDLYQAEHGKTVGPLHGVPVSIKEHIAIAGTSASYGFLGSAVQSSEDCHMVAILRRQGAVLYCKTNQPQSLMHLETDSHFGRTLNPFNIHLSSGGSTGGEAALIAMKGSVLGVGTDIGGSIRAPAAFCGIYGFKTTSRMLPMDDYLLETVPPELNILVATGPMCRSLRDLDLFMRVVHEVQPWLLEPAIIPLPWTGLQTPLADTGRQQEQRRLKIGIVTHDGFIEPQPPVKRALAWVRETLLAPGHAALVEVKDFTPFGAAEAWRNARLAYYPDGGAGMRDGILAAGEPVHPLSDWIWKAAESLGPVSGSTVVKYRDQRDRFRRAFAADWQRQDVDIIIGPTFVGPAPAHDTAFYWNYTSLYNYVDYPGLVFPTPVTASDGEQYQPGYSPLSEACSHVKSLWESSSFKGAPIALQVIAPRYHDNELFGAMAVLKDILNLP